MDGDERTATVDDDECVPMVDDSDIVPSVMEEDVKVPTVLCWRAPAVELSDAAEDMSGGGG